MGYVHTLIAVAEDCPAVTAQVPAVGGGKPTVAAFQYALLVAHPYEFTQEDVLFRTGLRGVEGADWEALRESRWADRRIRPSACLRAPPQAVRLGAAPRRGRQGSPARCGVRNVPSPVGNAPTGIERCPGDANPAGLILESETP